MRPRKRSADPKRIRMERYTPFDISIFVLAAVIALVAVSGLASAAPGTPPANASKVIPAPEEAWTHQGRTVVLRHLGGQRFAIAAGGNGDLMHDVRAGGGDAVATGKGVWRGDELVRGWRIGRRIVGRARLGGDAATRCAAPVTFPVRGWVSPEGDRVVLSGPVPRLSGCRVVAWDHFAPAGFLRFDRQAD